MIAGCCEFMEMMLVAESGAERTVMDEESDLEQIKGCQKLLVSSNLFLTLTFWYIYRESLLHPKSFPGCELQTVFSKMAAIQCSDSFSSKSKIDQPKCWCYRINKMRPVIPWVEDSVSAEVEQFLSCVRCSFPALHEICWSLSVAYCEGRLSSACHRNHRVYLPGPDV